MVGVMSGRLIGIVITALLGYSLFGYDTGVVSGGAVMIADEFHLQWYEKEILVSITTLCCCVSVAVGGVLGDSLGRRLVMMLSAVFYIAGPLASALAPNYQVMLVGRALLGVGVGLSFVVVPIYISESAPDEVRGVLVDLSDLIIVSGQLLAGLLNGIAESCPFITWRASIAGAIVIAVLQLLMLIWAPESPRWLVANNQRDKAIEVLTQLKGKRGHDKVVSAAILAEVAKIEESLQKEKKVDSSIWSTPGVKRSLTVGSVLMVMNQMTGINTVMYYGATIMENAGFNEKTSVWLASLCGFAQFVGVCFQVLNIDRRGRRFTALVSALGVAITVILLGLAFALNLNWCCVVMMMLYLIAFGSGMSGVPFVMNAEIHPLEIRARCNAITGLASWILNFSVGTTFPVILHYCGAQYAFWSYGVVGIVSFCWLWKYLPETTHVPLESIGAFFEDPYPKAAWADNGFNGLRAVGEVLGLSSDEEESTTNEQTGDTESSGVEDTAAT